MKVLLLFWMCWLHALHKDRYKPQCTENQLIPADIYLYPPTIHSLPEKLCISRTLFFDCDAVYIDCDAVYIGEKYIDCDAVYFTLTAMRYTSVKQAED